VQHSIVINFSVFLVIITVRQKHWFGYRM